MHLLKPTRIGTERNIDGSSSGWVAAPYLRLSASVALCLASTSAVALR